uniref:PDZ domain-containing protein n=1 Tax=Romanomermis culicivorax TaxID=13658 RepID=A0A915HS08_ROMCU
MNSGASSSTIYLGIMTPYQIRNFSRYCQKHRARNLKFPPLFAFGSIFTAGIYVAHSLKDTDVRKNVTGQVKKLANHISLMKLRETLEKFRDAERKRKSGHMIRNTKTVNGENETSLTWEEASEKSLASIVKVESVKRPFLMNSLTLVLNQKIGFICQRGLVLTDSSITRGEQNNDFRITFNNGRIFYGRIPFQSLAHLSNVFALIEFHGGHDILPLTLRIDPFDSPMEVLLYKLNHVTSDKDTVLSSVRDVLNILTESQAAETSQNIKPGANNWADLVEALLNKIAPTRHPKPSVPSVNDGTYWGSPIIDQNCNVVGILKQCDRYGTVVSRIDHLKTFLEKYCSGPISFSALRKIGLVCVPLNPQLKTEMNTLNSWASPKQVDSQASGHLVCTVDRNSISDKCGIKPGDIITHVNNEPLRSIIDLALELKSDRKIKVRVKRGQTSEEIILKF